MLITIAPQVRLFVDVEGASLVPDGPALRVKPTLILLHGGPGYDHSGFKPAFSALADVAQIVYYTIAATAAATGARPRSGRWTPLPMMWCGCATRWA